jgi:transcription initiation factor TFIIE subunit alpha
MKITKNQIEEAIEKIAGPDGLAVYKLLKGKEDVNEFELAEKLEVTINQIRNIIYRFEKFNLLTNIRKKDRRKGWYIYFWTLHEEKLQDMVIKIKKEKIARFENLLKLEDGNEFYTCPSKCLRLDSNDALDNGYMCPDCGTVLKLESGKGKVNKIKREIKALKLEIGED